MSIASMNWALRQRLSSAHQQILLYVIADSADPNGVTRHCDPGYLEEHARMTRATMFRRLGELEELGLLQRLKFYSERGAPIYEIRLALSAAVDIPIKRRKPLDDDTIDDDSDGAPESQIETMDESQPETPLPTKVSPSAAPESHSCDSICPPVSEDSPPNPPPGGGLSKGEREQSEKREAIWTRFVEGYPGIAAMDQQAAREEFDGLSLDDAEWAVSVLMPLKEELKKLGRPAKNAHLWLKKAMFRNFPRRKITDPPPEGVWIVEGSDQDRALRFARRLTKSISPMLSTGPDGSRGYLHKTGVGEDLLAMLAHEGEVPLRWPVFQRGSPEFAAWQRRFTAWIGRGLPIEPGSDSIQAPRRWHPNKDGTWPETGPPSTDIMTADDLEHFDK